MKQAIRALVIGVASSIGCALAWLYLEPSVGGLFVGVVAGWLASLAYPQLVNLLYWRKSTDTSTEAPPFSVLIVVVTTVALTFVFIHVFQQYTLDVETNRNISLVDVNGPVNMRDVAYDGQRLVAVGSFKPNGKGDAYQDAALWEADAEEYAWTRLPHDHELLGGVALDGGGVAHRQMNGVYAAPDEFLIVGWDTAPTGKTHGQVWKLPSNSNKIQRAEDSNYPDARFFSDYDSHDSTEILIGGDQENAVIWRREAHREWVAESLGPNDSVQLDSVKYQQGLWSVTGSDRSTDSDNKRDAAIWTSSNGAAPWTKADGMSGIPGSQTVTGVCYSHGLWVAVGEDTAADVRAIDAAIWVSDDAQHWRRFADRSLSAVKEIQQMNGLVVAGDHLIAVGTEVPDDDTGGEASSNEDASTGQEKTRANAVWRINFTRSSGFRSVSNRVNELMSMFK